MIALPLSRVKAQGRTVVDKLGTEPPAQPLPRHFWGARPGTLRGDSNSGGFLRRALFGVQTCKSCPFGPIGIHERTYREVEKEAHPD